MSRRAIPLFALLFLAAPLSAAPVPAQPKPDDSTAPSAIKLLEHRKIQKELKMSAEQRIVLLDGLADIEEDYEKKIIELANMPNAPEEAYEKLDKERLKAVDKLLTGAEKNLTATQRARLRQCDWRLRGPAAFTDPQVAKKLQLTDAQKKKAADATERLKSEVQRYFQGEGDENEATRKNALFEFRKARVKEVEDALTADQKTAWATMLGDASTGFSVDELWLKIEEELDLMIVPGGIGK
jgi:hypothetical protein